MRAWMAGTGRVPRAADRKGSAGAAGRCPWLWRQGRGTSSWHLLSPCREARTAPARPDSKRLLCPRAVSREPAKRDGQGRGATSQWGPPAPLQSGCPRPQPCPPACSASVSPASCRVRLCRGGGSVEPGSPRSHLAEGHSASDVAEGSEESGDLAQLPTLPSAPEGEADETGLDLC